MAKSELLAEELRESTQLNHFQPPFVVFNFSSQRFTQRGRTITSGRTCTSTDNGELLILNLTSRKQFWMKKSSIQKQIIAKLEEVAGDRPSYGKIIRYQSWCHPVRSMPREIETGKQEIEMNYCIEFNNFRFGNKITLRRHNVSFYVCRPYTLTWEGKIFGGL